MSFKDIKKYYQKNMIQTCKIGDLNPLLTKAGTVLIGTAVDQPRIKQISQLKFIMKEGQ